MTEERVRLLFDAMNAQDADGAAALVSDDVRISIGSETMAGTDAVRMLATQEDPQLRGSVGLVAVEAEDHAFLASGRRLMYWRESGDLAEDRVVQWRVGFDDAGQIDRLELVP